MTIFGIDVHPDFQVGLNIEAVAAEGFTFMATKVSEATTVYDSQDWLRRGKAAGMLCLGYHYLRPGNEAAQAQVFADQLARAGVPGMLDAEALSAAGAPTLTTDGIHRFLDAAANLGAHVPLLYLPRWYWERMGSPDLGGLPMLWASAYVTGTGFAAALFEASPPRAAASYGGLSVAVLQFTDQAHVAGQRLDANAFLGTRDEFASLIGVDDVSAADVWNYELPDPYIAPDGTPATPKTAADLLGWAATHAAYALEQAKAARGDVAELQKAITALATVVSVDPDITPAEFKDILDAELGKIVTVQVSVDGAPVVKP